MSHLARLTAYSIAFLLLAWSSATAQTFEEAKLTASDGAVDDYFGRSVAVSGDTAVVGAYGDDGNRWDSGAAYVFHYDGSDWVEEAKLLASDGESYDRFGLSVAVSGDTAVVGAHHDDDNGYHSGSAYVFRYDGSDWVEEAKLLASDGESYDLFGVSVAVSGDTAVVGAHVQDRRRWDSGSAYVFRYDGSDWIEEAKLTESDGAADDQFGISVAVSGDTAVVGASRDDDNGRWSGSTYVFRYDGSDWVEEAKLTASDGAADDEFGGSVAVFGDTAMVGAYHDDDNGGSSGSGYIFRYDGSDWVEETKLLASDGASYDLFGASVAVSGDTAVVGARGDHYSGSAYVFRYDGSDWVEETKLLASDGAPHDLFGASVAVSGDTAVVGAYWDDDNGGSSGSAYVFILPVEIDIKPGSCPNSWNRESNGVLPVAILGTEDFDVTQIDVSSVTISRADGTGGSVGPNEGPPGPHSEFEDVGTPFEGQVCDCHKMEGDGILDLSMKFKTRDVADLLPVDDPNGALVPLVVRGTLLDGSPFLSNSDCVRLVPPGSPTNAVTVQSIAGGWVDTTPLDNNLDGGGFGSFKRTYPNTTWLTLTAPSSHGGNPFVGWRLDEGDLVQGRSITFIVNNAEHSAKAVFKKANGCGLGFELAFMVPPLMWLRERRRRRMQ